MRKLKIGDLFEFETAKGTAYLQHAFLDHNQIELVRVLPFSSEKCPNDFEKLVSDNELFMIQFPLAAASRKGIVKSVGNFPLPRGFSAPQFKRTEHIVRGEFLGWHIVDVFSLKREFTKTLTDAQKKLSPYGIWNDTLLRERLESGWTLSNWQG